METIEPLEAEIHLTYFIQELQRCFDSKDIQMLQDVLVSMEPKEAEMWLKKCIDSGLWVPGPTDGAAEGGTSGEPAAPESCNSTEVTGRGV